MAHALPSPILPRAKSHIHSTSRAALPLATRHTHAPHRIECTPLMGCCLLLTLSSSPCFSSLHSFSYSTSWSRPATATKSNQVESSQSEVKPNPQAGLLPRPG